MQLVVGNRAIKLDRVFQLLHRDAHAFEKQAPGLTGHAQRFKAAGFVTRRREAQLDTFRDQLLHAGADQAAQMLAVTEDFDAVRRRGILVHFAEDGFQRFNHRLLAVEVQRTHFVPRVAIEQIDAAHQAVLLLAKAENIKLAEIKVHHLVTERRCRVVLQVDDNRQMADFARAVERFRRWRRQAQREVVRDIGNHLLQLRQIDNAVALNKQARTRCQQAIEPRPGHSLFR